MNASYRRPNLETWLFALAVILAFALRLFRLGDVPLSDEEARWAMQAFDLTKGLHPAIGSQPAYVLLTALAFYVLQASNFVARLVPALTGAALVFAPRLFRDRLGNKATLVLSFVAAIEPGLLALSRQAGSPIIVLAAIIFALGFWRAGNLRSAGIAAGLALLSGPMLWPGLIGLALAYFLSLRILPSATEEISDTENQPLFDRQQLITAGSYALGTYLALGSFFLLVPSGLSAGLSSLPDYIKGWATSSTVSPLYLLLALLVYELLAVALAAIHLARGFDKQDRLAIFLGLWLVIALVLAVVYPSRQVADLIWVLVPLGSLASLEIARHLNPVKDGLWETLGMMALTIAILIFALFNFLTIAISPLDMSAASKQLGNLSLTAGETYGLVVLGALVLLGASVALVSYGWSNDVAIQGSVWGLLAMFIFYTLSSSMAAANLRTYRTSELWSPGPEIAQADALLTEMKDLSRWSKGTNLALDVFVAGTDSLTGKDSPGLRWLLRDWKVTYSTAPTLTGTPAFVISASNLSAPQLTSAYRGQDFVLRDYPSWDSNAPSDWLRWAILHTLPKGEDRIILWTRSDIFVDTQNLQP